MIDRCSFLNKYVTEKQRQIESLIHQFDAHFTHNKKAPTKQKIQQWFDLQVATWDRAMKRDAFKQILTYVSKRWNMNYNEEIEQHLVGVICNLLEEAEHELHPFHATAVEAGLKHSNTYTRGGRSIHTYLPDHHWKSGVQLITHKRKNSPDRHEMERN